MDKKNLSRNISLAISAALIIGFIALQFTIIGSKRHGGQMTPVSVSGFGGPYTLVNQEGEAVTEQNLLGQYQMIYFGFTYCPAICPTELSKITDVMNQLGDDGSDIQPLFITVDPERDTAEVLKGYLELFHPRFIGYTGTVKQIEDIKRLYKVYSAKVDDPSMSEYTVDHSSYIYFLDPEGRLLSLYKIDDGADYIAKDVRKWLEHDQDS